jgi:hypothetical protein
MLRSPCNYFSTTFSTLFPAFYYTHQTNKILGIRMMSKILITWLKGVNFDLMNKGIRSSVSLNYTIEGPCMQETSAELKKQRRGLPLFALAIRSPSVGSEENETNSVMVFKLTFLTQASTFVLLLEPCLRNLSNTSQKS